MVRTSDLKSIKSGKSFTWGDVVKIHEIGEYTIVEYNPFIYKNCCSTGEIDTKNTEFSCYISGNDISRGADSLDSAIVTCIAYKHDGCNSRASSYFMKMIKEG